MSNEWPSSPNPGPDVPPPPPSGPPVGQPVGAQPGAAPGGQSPYAPPPGYGTPGYAYAPGTYPPAAPGSAGPATNGFAVASLVLSLLGLLTGITALVGIALGFVALSQIKRTGQGGRGLAIAGIIIGFVILALTIIGIVIAVAIGAWMFNNAPSAIDKISVAAELASASSAQEAYRADHGSYADTEQELEASGFSPTPEIDLSIVRAGETAYCMQATRSTATYYVTQGREPRSGSCPVG